MAEMITVETVVNKPLEILWDKWTNPEHIVNWNFASDDWHCPHSENDLRVGGAFTSTMAAKDGSMSFDFGGVYDEVEEFKKISYTMGDGRRVTITFEEIDDGVMIVETFDSEKSNSSEMQRRGWQSIMDNFKKYAELE